MKSVTAHLNFDGNCHYVMSFYIGECLNTELLLKADLDAKGLPSSYPAARIMPSQMPPEGVAILMASDLLKSDLTGDGLWS